MLLSAALLLVRLISAAVVGQPGYTDAYYYHDVARRLAAGQGLTADFVWSPLEAGPGATLPVASHRFWMPLVTVLQALGIVALPFLDSFRAAQAPILAAAVAIPLVGYAAARSLGAGEPGALLSAALAGLGGAFAPGWVSLDAFAPAAVLGTSFFLVYGRAARGDARAGLLAGLLVGLLFLARGEGALFGVALLPLLWHPERRRAGLAATAVALTIGLAWLGRDLALGLPAGMFARTALLLRYEDFFAVVTPSAAAVLADLPQFIGAKIVALGMNLGTLLIGFFVLLLPPMAMAARARARRPDVRAFAGLLVLVYLAESLVWTLHSTRGSYFHSLAAFFPYGVALGVVGIGALLERRSWNRRPIAVVAVTGVAAVLIVSAVALGQWDAIFNATYRSRVAALERIPPGPFLAVDAAAWRWISGRSVVVTPADGLGAICSLPAAEARSIVLEATHFSAYDDLYRGRAVLPGASVSPVGGSIRVYPLPPSARGCLP